MLGTLVIYMAAFFRFNELTVCALMKVLELPVSIRPLRAVSFNFISIVHMAFVTLNFCLFPMLVPRIIIAADLSFLLDRQIFAKCTRFAEFEHTESLAGQLLCLWQLFPPQK